MAFLKPVPLERDADAVEMMDRPCTFGELAGELRAIARINRFFGGSRLTVGHVRRLLERLPADRIATVLDVGAGAADIPVALMSWARRSGRPIRVLALDLSAAALTHARGVAAAYPEIAFLQGDALGLPVHPESVDVVISAMTLHHLQPEEGVRYLTEIDAASRIGWVVNALVRGRVAHRLAWAATRVFSRSAMARHDGPMSILRSYTPPEVVALCEKAGLFDVAVTHYPMVFRQCAVRTKP